VVAGRALDWVVMFMPGRRPPAGCGLLRPRPADSARSRRAPGGRTRRGEEEGVNCADPATARLISFPSFTRLTIIGVPLATLYGGAKVFPILETGGVPVPLREPLPRAGRHPRAKP